MANPTKKIPKFERLLNLVSSLLKSPVPVPWSGIRNTVAGYDDEVGDVSLKRRFERDKDELRSLGLPVEFVKTPFHPEGGYVINKDDIFLPPIEITSGEALALSVAAAGISGAKGSLQAEARNALLKLVASVPAQVDSLEPPDERMVLSLGLPASGRVENLRQDIAAALANRKSVIFSYCSLTRESPRRTRADPYGLAVWGGHWYVVGFCRRHKEIRVWNVERILSNLEYSGSGPDYEIPKDFDVRRYVGLAEWELPVDKKAIAAAVVFQPDIAWMIEESRLSGAASPGETFRRQRDGRGVLKIRVTDRQALVNWVLKFGKNAQIVSPPSLVRLAAETLRRAIKIYE